MATLTNTKIKDTYKSLLKVSDNGNLEASLQEITDGEGNASGVQLNTGGDLTASGTVAFGSLKDSGENITITKFVDEADGIGANDNDTSIPTSAAVKNYVDTNVTAQDLDFAGDSGTGAVDLDSQTFTIAGTANEIETSASGQTITIGLPSTITANVTGNVSGDLTGTVLTAAQTNITSVGTLSSLAVSGDLVLADGGNIEMSLGTTSTAKIGQAVRAYMEVERNDLNGIIKFFTTSAGGGFVGERMRIDASGNVGIGESSPDNKIHIKGGSDTASSIKLEKSGSSTAVLTSYYLGTFTDDDFRFYTNSSERMRILSSGGLTFNGDTAAANALDDYEEGTWTPTYTTADGDFDTIDYGTQSGRYTKIGRVVYCDLMLRAGNITYSGAVTSSSNVRIGGLPFSVIGGFAQAGGSISFINNWGNINNPNAISAQANTSVIALNKLSDTAAKYAVNVSDLDTGAANSRNDIRMSFFYFV